MTFDPEIFLERFDALDAALVAKGFPATSPWWRAQIARFVRSGCRRWVIRAGRRAGKSTTLCRLAVAWALWGSWSVPPGDVAVVPFVSVSKDEAGARLRTIAAVLRALGIGFEQRGDELELTGVRAVLFRTIACTTSAVVGFTSIAIFGDEVARWESRDVMANPAREVVGSLMPTLATQDFGFAALCSSPWSTDDYHAELFDTGNTGQQTVSFGASWECNPTLTEERTHELEPDLRTWQREYAAVPGATVSAAFDPKDVADCFGRAPKGNLRRGFVATDASSLLNDDFSFIAGAGTESGEIAVLEAGGWSPDDCKDMGVVVDAIAKSAKRWNATVVFGDQREATSLRTLFAQRRVTFKTYDWTEPSKDDAVQLLRRMMREHRLILPDHDRLRRELVGLKAHLLPSGRIKYATNGKDYASALITLAHAMVAKDFHAGPSDFELMARVNERMAGHRLGVNEPGLPFHQRHTRWGSTRGRGFG